MKKNRPFKIKLSVMIYVLCFIIIALYSLIQYRYSVNIFRDKFEQEKMMVEEQVLLAVKDTDISYSLLELQYDDQMRNALYEMRLRYDSDGKLVLPGRSDVPGLNFYIVNENNTVIKTTDPIDQGLSFNGVPDFVMFLNGVRRNNAYMSDRLSFSLRDNRVMRYSYLSSKDGRYIFEAGINMQAVTQNHSDIGFDTIDRKMKNAYPFVEQAMVFDRDGKSYTHDDKGQLIEIEKDKFHYIEEAIAAYHSIDVTEKVDGYERHYRYIPFQIEKAVGTNQKNVIEVIYNNKNLIAELTGLRQYTFGICLVWLIMSALLSVFLAQNVSKPIEVITEAVKEVSTGNFLVKTGLKTGDELETLSQNFDQMVRTISELREEDYTKQVELEDALAENQRLYYETVHMLANAIEAKDHYTGGHCDRVKDYALMIGRELKLNEREIQNLIYGSILHDIGKIGISENILCKEGKLEDYELDLVRQHPEIGLNILQATPFLNDCRRIVYEHHERYDGKGYPQKLIGSDIDLLARIIAVVDSYDAMTSIRPYRRIPLTVEEALEELRCNAGTQFDPDIVDIFIRIIESNKAT